MKSRAYNFPSSRYQHVPKEQKHVPSPSIMDYEIQSAFCGNVSNKKPPLTQSMGNLSESNGIEEYPQRNHTTTQVKLLGRVVSCSMWVNYGYDCCIAFFPYGSFLEEMIIATFLLKQLRKAIG